MSDFVSPGLQAMNIIRYIGDRVIESGEPIRHINSDDVYSYVGSPSGRFAAQLITELYQNDLITYSDSSTVMSGRTNFTLVNLTLNGWQQFEAEQRGDFMGSYGFLAMQFNDNRLDDFVENTLKPTVAGGTGYDLIDMRDVPEAGVIDNIIRQRIRDSRFVIVDLTHDNNGAYWEAGYAEGLGKPVVYICEKVKFESEGTHFDTNHCTTVPWSLDKPEEFTGALVATLRRSLDLD